MNQTDHIGFSVCWVETNWNWVKICQYLEQWFEVATWISLLSILMRIGGSPSISILQKHPLAEKKLYYIWARLRRWWANNMHATAPPSSAVFKAIGAIPKSSIIACYIVCVCSKPLSASSWFMMISWIINNFETHGDPKSHDHISDKFPACCRNSAQFHPQIIISLSFVYAQILCRLIISLAFVLV